MDTTTTTLGTEFARALAAKEYDRIRVRNPDGLFLVEQQVYLEERDGKIGWMRSVCSGFRPI
jgi:hypothetical protein